MKKGTIAALLSFGVGLWAVNDQADARRRPARPRATVEDTPVSAEIGVALGKRRWGMPRADLVAGVEGEIRAEFQPQLAKAPGAIEEDRLRAQMDARLQKLRNNVVEFRGQSSGWKVSFVGDQIRDNAGQSMVVVDEPGSQKFFFFSNDRLYKMFVAFNSEMFPGMQFEQFAERIQQKFGPARRIMRTHPRTQEEALAALRWQDDTTDLFAIDRTEFYGIFCLVFVQKGTEDPTQVAAPRAASNPAIDEASRPVVQDQRSDVVDSITGRNRAVQAAPAPAKAPGRGRAGAGEPPDPDPGQPEQAPSADPLGGLLNDL